MTRNMHPWYKYEYLAPSLCQSIITSSVIMFVCHTYIRLRISHIQCVSSNNMDKRGSPFNIFALFTMNSIRNLIIMPFHDSSIQKKIPGTRRCYALSTSHQFVNLSPVVVPCGTRYGIIFRAVLGIFTVVKISRRDSAGYGIIPWYFEIPVPVQTDPVNPVPYNPVFFRPAKSRPVQSRNVSIPS